MRQPRLLTIAGHVRPGTIADPADAAILLDSESGETDPVTVADLSALEIPPWCLILGCDGSGAVTGGEWTGVLTGLAWAGASQIATSTVPVIDDDLTASWTANCSGTSRPPARSTACSTGNEPHPHGISSAPPYRPPPTAGQHTSPPARRTRGD
jgi:hypothetical protein